MGLDVTSAKPPVDDFKDRSVKIATAQTVITRDVPANGTVIRRMISDAASDDVRLISFCEGALSGYSKSQILKPEDWRSFDWIAQEVELRAIAELCGKRNISAVVGGAHPLTAASRPHNSLYVFSATGALLTRYDKRFLSNSEISDWYTPGTDPVVFELDGYRFGCAICIERQFAEVFSEYERLGVDAVLFSSYGIPEHFQIALRAHAGLNCLWISAATPAQEASKGPAGILGPDGQWLARCPDSAASCYTMAILDRDDPQYDVPLKKARPWRARARMGDIYRERTVNDPRSTRRDEY